MPLTRHVQSLVSITASHGISLSQCLPVICALTAEGYTFCCCHIYAIGRRGRFTQPPMQVQIDCSVYDLYLIAKAFQMAEIRADRNAMQANSAGTTAQRSAGHGR